MPKRDLNIRKFGSRILMQINESWMQYSVEHLDVSYTVLIN